jgi:hypothetical protein
MGRNLDYLRVLDGGNANGVVWKYDYTNKTLRAYTPGPKLIVEEVLTVASSVGTLAYTPAYIVAVDVTAGTTTGGFHVIPTGETPLTREVAVTLTSGLCTFVSTDAVTSARITYVPLRTGGYFIEANRVIDEVVVAAAAKTNLANRACLVQYVWDNTDNILNVPEPVGEAPTATHNCVIDMTNGSNTTDIDSHADDEGNSLKVTYWKHAALPHSALYIDDADVTLTTEAFNFHTGTGTRSYVVMPGLGTYLVGEETATNVTDKWAGPSVTASTTQAQWNPIANTITTDHATAITTTAIPYLILDTDLLFDGSLLEMGRNVAPPAQTLIVEAVGW